MCSSGGRCGETNKGEFEASLRHPDSKEMWRETHIQSKMVTLDTGGKGSRQ